MKMLCRCGEQLRTSGAIPNPIEWKIISDQAFDRFSGQVDAELVYLACESAFRCPNCDRLWVYWDGFGAQPTCYTSEQ